MSKLNYGAGASGEWLSGTGFDSGNQYTYSDVQDVSGLPFAVPQEVAASLHYAQNANLTLGGFTPNSTQKFAFIYSSIDQTDRFFTVRANGTIVDNNLNPYIIAGNVAHKLIMREYQAVADGAGTIVFNFSSEGQYDWWLNAVITDYVADPPPTGTLVASFTKSTSSGVAPLTVNFTDTSTNATSWLWNFGDGTTSTAQNPTKTFTTVGTFTVQLTVSNEEGGSNSTSQTVTVTDGTTTTTKTARLEWSRPSNGGVDHYILAESLTSDFANQTETQITDVEIFEKTVNTGTSYYWKIKKVDANGTSFPYSNVITIIP